MEFFIGSLVPGRITPNYESLEFLVGLLRSKGSFDSLEEFDPMLVLNFNGVLCLAKGNNRALIYALNGITQIRASEQRAEDCEEIRNVRKRFDEIRLARRIHSIYDIACLIKEPEKYIV